MKRRDGSKKDFESELAVCQLEMLAIQRAYHRLGRRAVLVFEGWDAAGKGGAIRRMTEKLDPRGYTVHPIGAPKSEEQGRHYLYRFWKRLPKRGQIAIFDRSWYGRVLVERVEEFADVETWSRAFDEINAFEKMLADDGVRILKFFLHITPDEQRRRFVERLQNPYKRWKLTPEDLRNRGRWTQYEKAIDEMHAQTSTAFAPWTIVPGDHKWTARLKVIQHTVRELSAGVDLTMPPIDPALKKEAESLLGVDLDDASAENLKRRKKEKKGRKARPKKEGADEKQRKRKDKKKDAKKEKKKRKKDKK